MCWQGDVKLFFQSGEEGHFGAKITLDEGLLDGPRCSERRHSRFMSIPVWQWVGPRLAPVRCWRRPTSGAWRFAGRGADTRRCLRNTRDPISAACEIVGALFRRW